MSDATNEPGAGRSALGADLILPLFAVALTLYYLIDTWALSWEAKATGFIVGMVLLALCTVQILRVMASVIGGRASLGLGALTANTQDNRRRLALVILAALYIATIEYVGTTLGLFLLLYAGMWLMGVRNITTLLAISVITPATVYVLLIYLLGSRLPRGVIEKTLALFGIGA